MRHLAISLAFILGLGCTSDDDLAGHRPLALQSSDPNNGTTCGNGFCEPGETHGSCSNDCCETGSDGACLTVCGNGFCDGDETHTSCASDCCDVGADGYCTAQCGNGFCELAKITPLAKVTVVRPARTARVSRCAATDFAIQGRNHESCATDCCPTNTNSACCKIERLRGTQIDDEIELGRLLDRNVGRLRPTQNLVNDNPLFAGTGREVWTIGHQRPRLRRTPEY